MTKSVKYAYVFNILNKTKKKVENIYKLTILRSIMEHPSAQRRVGKVSKPSERHNARINLIPFWQSGVSAKELSPVDFV